MLKKKRSGGNSPNVAQVKKREKIWGKNIRERKYGEKIKDMKNKMTEFTHLFIWNRISGRNWENEEEVIFKEVMIEKFAQLMKYINSQIENHSVLST